MMAMRRAETRLIDRLPPVRGSYREGVTLASITWFRVGGPAEVVFRPADEVDLQHFLATRPADVPVTVVGVGSNLLVRDGGILGVVIRLGRAFARTEVCGNRIVAGAAALDLNVALTARDAGIGGLEFLSGIPGTIGGAVRMNAGAYGADMQEIVVRARLIDASGQPHDWSGEELGFGYRHSAIPKDWVVVSAELKGRPEDPVAIDQRIQAIRAARESTQPIRARTGGSTFANPSGMKAWELIDRAGCRGLMIGGAQVSPQHCNFLINTGTATAADLEALGEEVRRQVRLATGVELRWEIDRVGVPQPTSKQGDVEA